MKRRRLSDSPDNLNDSGVAGTSYESSVLDTSGIENVAGKIETLEMVNFMCHSNFTVNFNSRINFITGRNGSGKSAIMAALTIVLGGSASLSNRGKKISDLIKKGENFASLTITLANGGSNAYKPHEYGSRVVICRNITRSGASSYVCRSAKGAVVSRKKEEVDNIVSVLNLQIGNPVCVLNQDVARSFLCSTDKSLRFKMFMKATQLEELKAIYMETLASLVSTNREMKDKEKGMEDAIREVNQLKEKLEYFAALEKRVQERTRLENEYVWALVADEEKRLQSLKERRNHLLEKKEEWTRGEADSENLLRELENAVSECQNELERRKKAKEEKSAEVAAVQREVRGFEKEIEKAEARLEVFIRKKERQLADINGVEEHLQKNDSMASQSQAEKEEAKKKMNMLRQMISDVKDQVANAQRQVTTAEEAEAQHMRHLENLRTDLEEIDQTRRRLDATLSETRAKGQNNCLKYGPHTQELLQAIEDAAKKNHFVRKPVGPCGMHVTLSGDPKWARAVESLIGSLMTTYCCDNQKDFQVLSRIMDRICGNRQPPIIISKFQGSRHYVESEKVSLKGFQSVLDVLSFDDDVVFNTFVDQAQIEQILLFETDHQAASVLTHLQNVPRNLKMGLTLQSDQYFPAPNYRTYYGKPNQVLRFFDKLSKGGDVKRLEGELQVAKRTLLVKREEFEKAKEALGTFRSEVNLCKISLKRLKQEEGKIQMELNHLIDLEDTRPVTITKVALQDELESLQRKYKEASEEVSLCGKELDNMRGTRDASAARLNSLAMEEAEAEAALNQLDEELEKRRATFQDLMVKRKGANQRLGELNDNLNRVVENIQKCGKDLQKRLQEAEEVCPDRVETERSAVDVQKQLKSCERHLQAAERVAVSKEATIEEFKSKKASLDEMKKKQKLYADAIATVGKAALMKEERLEKIQSYTAGLVSLHFQATLKTRGYDGDLKVDFKNQTLELEVKPKDAGVARKDSKTLSGGERSYSTVSFILALWKVVHMPFYFLDEFDVFMDRVNRKFIMDLLLDHAKLQSNKQFVFITPQDISGVTASDLISIFRMEDPERGTH